MRTVLRLLGTRYGIALILVVVVLGIVGIARALVRDGDPSGTAIGPTVGPASSEVDPAASLGDDSVVEPSSAAPSLSAGAQAPATIATRFVTAWLRRPGVTADKWRAGMKPYASTDLMERLKDSDPADVPATAITGPVEVEQFGTDAQARVPADGGTVVLDLSVLGGRWQVTALDWEAS